MGLFSAIANIFGAGEKKKAIGKASKAQQAAAQAAADKISAQDTAFQQGIAPYLQTGTKALNASADLLGINGDGVQDTAIDALRNSPIYQQLYKNGMEAVLQNGSATGGLRGGNMQTSLANFGSDTLARVIQNQLANLGGLAGQGAQTGIAAGGLGAAAAGNVGNMLLNKGQAKAGGYIGQANAQAEQYGGIADLIGGIVGAMAGMPGGAGTMGTTLGKFI